MKPSKSAADQEYEVGYGKPPKAGQFRKGQSGNPKGRKRSEENFFAIFKRLVTKRVKVSNNGAVKTFSMAEAIFVRNYQAAMNQDETAMGNVLKLLEYAGETRDQHDPKVVGRDIFMPEPAKSIEEFLAANGAGVIRVGKQTSE
jgi:Family of unknown function (DUF5681)